MQGEVKADEVESQENPEVMGNNKAKTASKSLHFVTPEIKDGQRRFSITTGEVKSEVERWR